MSKLLVLDMPPRKDQDTTRQEQHDLDRSGWNAHTIIVYEA